MRHYSWPPWVQIMGCRLFGAKPLSEAMLAHWYFFQWQLFSQTWIKIQPLSYKKKNLKMSCVKWCQFCFGFKVTQYMLFATDSDITTRFLYIHIRWHTMHHHYSDVIKSAMGFQITCVSIVYSTVWSGAYQRKQQNSASLAFVWGIHRWPVNSAQGPVTRKRFPSDDVIMMNHSRCSEIVVFCWDLKFILPILFRVTSQMFREIIGLFLCQISTYTFEEYNYMWALRRLKSSELQQLVQGNK